VIQRFREEGFKDEGFKDEGFKDQRLVIRDSDILPIRPDEALHRGKDRICVSYMVPRSQ
jgi:hypothetical protein